MSEPITTQRDHTAAVKRAVDLAVSEATDARVGSRAIAEYLMWHAKRLEDQSYRHPMADQHDAMVQAAQRERQRKIDEQCHRTDKDSARRADIASRD